VKLGNGCYVCRNVSHSGFDREGLVNLRYNPTVLVSFDKFYSCPVTAEVTSIILNIGVSGKKERKPNSNDTWYGGY
jgi:hypothetical protein